MTDLDYMSDFISKKVLFECMTGEITLSVVMKPSTAIKPGKKKRIRVRKSGKKFD